MHKRILLITILGIFLFSFISLTYAVEVKYCCERLAETGAWCVNAPESQCDVTSNYKNAPTSCESTKFCSLGTCILPDQGFCMENTAQRTCIASDGFWKSEAVEDIPQCQLGCCLMADQSAFVTQTRCKKLSSIYGLETSFRTDITSEVACIATSSPNVKGACVFEKEFENTCKFTTKRECQDMKDNTPSSVLDSFSSQGDPILDVTFHENILCTDEELGTNCGFTEKTTCVEGRDEVFFLDSCGNIANIYDSEKSGNNYDPDYWSKVKSKDESCSVDGKGNKKCGNCDYFAGSTCKKKDFGESVDMGDFICKNLDCEDVNRKHGETWCGQSDGTGVIKISGTSIVEKDVNYDKENIPGSRYFRMLCYNNEVIVEPCADFRQEVCVESEFVAGGESFAVAACRANRWEGCLNQDNSKDCLNTDRRDCNWINSGNLKEGLDEGDIEKLNEYVIDNNNIDLDGRYRLASNGDIIEGNGKYFQYICVPKYAPGFDFYSESTEAGEICSIADLSGTVTYRADWALDSPDKDLTDCENEIGNCFLITPQWQTVKRNFCAALGDCGGKTNYIEKEGFRSWSELFKRE